MKMRFIWLLGLLPFAESALADQRDCVIELMLPRYAALAWQARIETDVHVKITIGGDGAPQRIEMTRVPAALGMVIEGQMKDSKFSRDCAGQVMEYSFSFRIQGSPSATPSNIVKFTPPNHFIITSRPPIINVN